MRVAGSGHDDGPQVTHPGDAARRPFNLTMVMPTSSPFLVLKTTPSWGSIESSAALGFPTEMYRTSSFPSCRSNSPSTI